MFNCKDIVNNKVINCRYDCLCNNLYKDTIQKNFWIDKNKAQKILKNIRIIKNEIQLLNELNENYENLKIFNELAEIEDQIDIEYRNLLNDFLLKINKMELQKLLSKDDDINSAIITIHPGAGGTESQDWANMLYRMYSRWIEKAGYKIKLIDYLVGDIAGIKEVTFEIRGDYAYGYLKSEAGIHRLVRISPFDSNAKRHTSFASIFVYPILEDDSDIEIDEKDIRIDTFRASGSGGQHLNKTDSAIRITHLPTNIVVQCQNERSQLKNKNTALKLLKSRLYQKQIDERKREKEKKEKEKKEISWGNQIRSYIFHPYNMVKDHRTNIENTNTSSVMNGDINKFIKGYLLKKFKNINNG